MLRLRCAPRLAAGGEAVAVPVLQEVEIVGNDRLALFNPSALPRGQECTRYNECADRRCIDRVTVEEVAAATRAMMMGG